MEGGFELRHINMPGEIFATPQIVDLPPFSFVLN